MVSKPAIFDDIAREAVNLCLQSLVSASQTIRSKHAWGSILDSYLFLVRHLLILKEITQNLDLENKNPERGVELSGMTGTSHMDLSRRRALTSCRNACIRAGTNEFVSALAQRASHNAWHVKRREHDGRSTCMDFVIVRRAKLMPVPEPRSGTQGRMRDGHPLLSRLHDCSHARLGRARS